MALCEPPPSEHDPLLPGLGNADLLEYVLLKLDDDAWTKVDVHDLAKSGGPVVTGDPVVDAWERDLWFKGQSSG